MKNSNIQQQVIEKVFEERKEFIVIGLTGQKGAGCSTVCNIMQKALRSLELEHVSLPTCEHKADEIREKRILRRFAFHNWEPFDAIRGRDIIMSFILENWTVFEEDHSDISDTDEIQMVTLFKYELERKCSEINSLDVDEIESERLKMDKKLLNTLKSMQDELERETADKAWATICTKMKTYNDIFVQVWCEGKAVTTDEKPILNQCYVYIHTILPLFSKVVHACLSKKSNYTIKFQKYANRIRFHGSIEKISVNTKPYKPGDIHEKMCTIPKNSKAFAFPARINSFIKALRHPESSSEDIAVRVVIDCLKNPYEVSYLRSRYTAFYLVAVSRDNDIRVDGLRERAIPVNDDEIFKIDLNERPSEAKKVHKKFSQALTSYLPKYEEANPPDTESIINEENLSTLDISHIYSNGDSYANSLITSLDLEMTGLSKREFDFCISAMQDPVRIFAYETGLQQFYLQDVEACIQDADIFIANNERGGGKENLKSTIIKYISLILHPGLVSPTPVERCMQIAYTAKVNSGCISRQVGAVTTDKNYNILSIGWNDVPCGQTSCNMRNLIDLCRYHDTLAYSDYEINSNSDFRINYLAEFDFSDAQKLKETLKGVQGAFCFKDAYCNNIIGEQNQVHTRAMHGEEKALSTCDQELVKGGFLFTTSSPCELCAKNAKQHQIKTIYYIEPYPGISQSHICNSGSSWNRAKYELFQGAIGRAYTQLYTPIMPMKDELSLRGFPNAFRKFTNK